MNHHITLTSIDPIFVPHITSALAPHTVVCSPTCIADTMIDPETTILGVFVDSHVDKTLIKELPDLMHIATFSTGYDHIDLKATKRKKITVSSVPHYGENTVAEYALALILALTRKLYPSVKRVKEGVYDYHALRGIDLCGKTVGIIGTGKIGMHLIHMLEGFNTKIIAYDPHGDKKIAKEHGFTYVPFDTLIEESHIISLHVPLLPTTKHMINLKVIKKMREGVYIINTARGGLIDSEALVWGLQTGHVAGAGLDVLEEELMFKTPEKILTLKSPAAIKRSLMENIIIDHPHTIVTPHNAFNSVEACQRIVDTAIDNILQAIKGNPTNLVK